MKVAVIDYKAGNVTSVLYALERLGAEAELTADSEKIRTADRVIFPGQGEASSAMRVLKETGIDKVIPELKQPFFGICLGLQLLCAHSEEKDTPCLGVFPVQVKRFRPENPKVDKVPQVGWNQLEKPNSPLLKGLPAAAYVYYVHSFYAELSPYTIAETTYTLPFSA
ncbi:imidazole glycerol phosphate synthase subunit HisH [Nitritalea halalkaliphila LW7]|uniref:Imidazole glycerol phosphate synthase subunit HisH n=1 Tax=Nitritalea halalkaliphila LW7 TaxID=1189621 RepID=I5BV33_9BACT|nr:imidazole glycerol phosphate synthase subunit HisH [Nitritalea halalkaliphila LW7]